MKTPESYEKDKIKAFLKSIGAEYFMLATGGFGSSGAPDIIACIEGKFWGIEVKREGKDPTPLQEARLKRIKEAGGWAVAGTAEVVIGTIRNWGPVCLSTPTPSPLS